MGFNCEDGVCCVCVCCVCCGGVRGKVLEVTRQSATVACQFAKKN